MSDRLHPIPPGLWCVPSALVAITGEDWMSVIHPALNRHSKGATLNGLVTGAHRSTTMSVLRELRYVARPAKDPRHHVVTWAKYSRERYPDEALLIFVPRHAIAMKNGLVYDSWTPHGQTGETHPYHNATAEQVYLVRKGS